MKGVGKIKKNYVNISNGNSKCLYNSDFVSCKLRKNYIGTIIDCIREHNLLILHFDT